MLLGAARVTVRRHQEPTLTRAGNARRRMLVRTTNQRGTTLQHQNVVAISNNTDTTQNHTSSTCKVKALMPWTER